MKFTIFGGTGFVGRHMAAYLLALGHEVFLPARDEKIKPECDLGHVIYCIGMTADFRSHPFETVNAHVIKLLGILKHCQFDSLLYLSSTRVYQGVINTKETSDLLVNPLNSEDLYQLSKLMGESVCLNSRRNTRIVRLSNVISLEDMSQNNFVALLYKEAQQGHIKLRSHLDSEKDYICIDDVVPLLYKVAIMGKKKIYNIASGCQIRHEKWVHFFCETMGCTFEVESNAIMTSFPQIDICQIKEEFNFLPRKII